MASTTSKRHRMRCNACRAAGRGSGRFTLPRHPDLYVRAVKCPACGETERLSSQEKDRKLELERRPSHSCSAYPFPHKPGTLVMCVDNPERVLGFATTEQEQEEYRSTLDTPRSAFDWGVDDEFDLDADDFEPEEIPF